jgi:hypothetical protein
VIFHFGPRRETWIEPFVIDDVFFLKLGAKWMFLYDEDMMPRVNCRNKRKGLYGLLSDAENSSYRNGTYGEKNLLRLKEGYRLGIYHLT